MVLGKHLVNLTEELGSGSFGIVYAGKHATSGKKVAVKKLTIVDEEAGRLALEEIKKYERLPKHPNLVEMIDYHYQRNAFWLVLEYCTDGTLEQFVCRQVTHHLTKLSALRTSLFVRFAVTHGMHTWA